MINFERLFKLIVSTKLFATDKNPNDESAHAKFQEVHIYLLAKAWFPTDGTL